MHYNNLAKQRHLGTMADGIVKVAKTLDKIEDLQLESRENEDVFLVQLENTSYMAGYVTLLQFAVLVIVNVYSIRNIRSWFKQHRKSFGI